MNIPLILYWLLHLFLLAQGQQDDEVALRHLKTVLWPKAYAEQDTVLLDYILADEFQSINNEGRWSTKVDELDWIAHNKLSHDSFTYEIKRLDIVDGHTAIVAGVGKASGNNKNGAYLYRYHSTNVLIKRDGRWQALASHVSGIIHE